MEAIRRLVKRPNNPRDTGSKVGFGMNLFTLPPTSRRVLPSSCAHCMARLR
ncbi:MAG: hypothetical protein JWM19_4518 [Actinomycetia bacterium]|nr:hypothetical protein [Actinomycetes bacterium]